MQTYPLNSLVPNLLRPECVLIDKNNVPAMLLPLASAQNPTMRCYHSPGPFHDTQTYNPYLSPDIASPSPVANGGNFQMGSESESAPFPCGTSSRDYVLATKRVSDPQTNVNTHTHLQLSASLSPHLPVHFLLRYPLAWF